MTEPTLETTASETSAPLRVRYRIRFEKIGLLRWTSHRDLARLWERIVRRADLKLSMSEGFHPKPRISFPSALALGVNGLDEVVELELAERMTVGELFQRLRDDNQPGLRIKSVKMLPDRFGKAQLLQSEYRISIPENADLDSAHQAISKLKSIETVSVERKKKTISVNVAEQIPAIQIVGRELHLTLAASESASLRPNDVLDLIGAAVWIENGAIINRTQVVLQKEFEIEDPGLIATSDSDPACKSGEGPT